MKHVCMFGGSALIGVITALCGVGWFSGGHFNVTGAIVNSLAVLVWVAICEGIFKEEE